MSEGIDKQLLAKNAQLAAEASILANSSRKFAFVMERVIDAGIDRDAENVRLSYDPPDWTIVELKKDLRVSALVLRPRVDPKRRDYIISQLEEALGVDFDQVDIKLPYATNASIMHGGLWKSAHGKVLVVVLLTVG